MMRPVSANESKQSSNRIRKTTHGSGVNGFLVRWTCLFLLGVTFLGWFESYRRTRYSWRLDSYPTKNTHFQISVESGVLILGAWQDLVLPYEQDRRATRWHHQIRIGRFRFLFGVPDYSGIVGLIPRRTLGLEIPFWILVLLPASVLAFQIIIPRVRMNRRLEHACQCGYDLTGNVSGTCPECGSVIERRAAEPINEN